VRGDTHAAAGGKGKLSGSDPGRAPRSDPTEAVGKTVCAHHACVRTAFEHTVPAAPPTSDDIWQTPPPPASAAGMLDVCGQERRPVTRTRERYAAVQQLLDDGSTLEEICRTLRLDRSTVRRFARATSIDELLVKATNRHQEPCLRPYRLASRSLTGRRSPLFRRFTSPPARSRCGGSSAATPCAGPAPSGCNTAQSHRLTRKPLTTHDPKDLGEPDHRAGTPPCPSTEITSPRDSRPQPRLVTPTETAKLGQGHGLRSPLPSAARRDALGNQGREVVVAGA
jgi:hypothetical protein